eukprot:3358617-Rhodomonas_salina.1
MMGMSWSPSDSDSDLGAQDRTGCAPCCLSSDEKRSFPSAAGPVLAGAAPVRAEITLFEVMGLASTALFSL